MSTLQEKFSKSFVNRRPVILNQKILSMKYNIANAPLNKLIHEKHGTEHSNTYSCQDEAGSR